MKSLIQSILVVAALCVGVAVSIPADGGPGPVIGNTTILPDVAPLEAECKVEGSLTFASCMQLPSHWSPSEQVMGCEARAQCAEAQCLSPHVICYIGH